MTAVQPDLVGRLGLADKVGLLTGETLFTLPAAPEIGLASIALSDGPTGVRGVHFVSWAPTCLLPNATLLASTWSEQTLHEVGALLAEEARRQHVHVVLGPTINLHRTPLHGRLFEAYSEDPLLTGKLAAAYVRGLQDQGIGACLKHLAANESETERHTVDVRVEEATLRELYLLPFEIAIAEAGPWSVMAAYNAVNGLTCTEQSHVNTEILKGEWGYDGLVVSDWFATTSTAASANGGLDVVMPGPTGPWGAALVDAVRAGAVDESVVDDHVRRLLRLADRVGALGERDWGPAVTDPASTTRRMQLTSLAAAGMTVLTNDGVLPIARDAAVVLIGRHAVDTVTMGGGSAQVLPPYSVDIADGLRALLSGRLTVLDGVEVRSRAVAARPGFLTDDGEDGLRMVATSADGRVLADRHLPTTQTLLGYEDGFDSPATSVALTGRFVSNGRAQVGVLGLGHWELTVGGQSFEVDLAPATADIGEAILRPPVWTTEVTCDDEIEMSATVHGAPNVFGRVGLVARSAPRAVSDVLAEAAAAARGADPAIVVVGLTEEQETEAADKTTLALPGAQDALVSAVAQVAVRTVVVVNAATPVLMPWVAEVDAVLWVGLPGQEGGRAVAAALVGDLEPAGRLVTSFPAADGASPAWSVQPPTVLDYTEGAFLGHRGYAAGLAPAPAFWFGHGLGYGSWSYGRAELVDGAAGRSVKVEITNTSGRPSREVVQVYLQPVESDQPIRLVGWSAIEVESGVTASVTVHCDARLWRRWDAAADAWTSLAPGGELVVARGLGDLRARLRLGAGE